MTDRVGLSGGPSEHPDAAGHRAADPAEAGQPPEAAGAPLAVAAAEGSQPSPEPRKPRSCSMSRSPAAGVHPFSRAFPSHRRCSRAAVSSRVWSVASPRPSVTGSGVPAAWVWRAFADRDPRRPRRRGWLAFFISAAVLYVVSFGLGQYWQYEIRKLMGVTDYNIPLVVASPFIAALVFSLLLLIGRGLHGLYRGLEKLLHPLDRAACREGGWLGAGGRLYLSGRWRLRASGLRQRYEQRVFAARHDDCGRGAPARDQPAVGRAGLAHTLGHAGLAKPQLHRQGAAGE